MNNHSEDVAQIEFLRLHIESAMICLAKRAAEIGTHPPTWGELALEAAKVSVEALTAKIAGLEGALRPFADACDNCIDQDEPDRNHTWEHPVGMNVTVGDYRAARAALSPKDGQKQDADGGGV